MFEDAMLRVLPEVADQATLRFNPLPSVSIASPAQALSRISQLAQWRDTYRQSICDALHVRAGEADGEERTRLIRLKRDVHNDRVPSDGDVGDIAIDEWLEARRESQALEATLIDDFDQRLAEERGSLRRICADPWFQRALGLSSRSLGAAAAKYAVIPLEDHRARQRKSESAFVQYLSRAQLRTSPYSWYTAVAVGRWEDGAAIPLRLPDALRVAVQVDHALVRRLLAALVKLPDVVDDVPIKVAPGAHVEADRFIFDIYADNPDNQPHVYGTVQRRGSLPLTDAVSRVVAWVRESRGRTRGQLLDALGGATPVTEAFVAGVFEAGLLLPDIAVADQSLDILGDSVSFLRALPGDAASIASDALVEIGAVIAGFGELEPLERGAALDVIREAARRSFEAAGAQLPPSPLLYEDVVAPEPVGLDRAAWQPLLDDLRAIGPFLELFDRTRVLKAMIRNAFVDRYGAGGRCDQIAEFEGAIAEAYKRWKPGAASPLEALERDDVALGTLSALQDEVVAHLAAGADSSEVEFELDGAFVEDVASRMPARAWESWSSYSVFGQPATGPGSVDEFVINHVYNGFGEYLTRFLDLVDESVTERLRVRIREFFGDDVCVAEMRPVFGFNANLHPLLAPSELSEWPADGELGFDDLVLVHDTVDDVLQVRDRATGERVEALYLGFLVPYLLPQRIGFLYALSGNGWVDLPYPERIEEAASAPDAIRCYPRLRFGRVVLARRRWYVPLDLVPRPQAGEQPAAYWLRLNAWRLAADMPDSTFYRAAPSRANAADDASDWMARITFRREKPQHVDFTSALHAKRFGKTLPDVGDVLLFEETAPNPEAALIDGLVGRHVTEAVIELDRPINR